MDLTLDNSHVVPLVPASRARLAAMATVRHQAAAAPAQAESPQWFDVYASLARSSRSNTEVASP